MTTDARADWLTVGKAAQRLGLSAVYVRRLADAGRLECERTPLGRLISESSIEKYRAAKEATS